MAWKITTKKHKKVPKLSKIAKFWNKVVYGGYVPAPYTRYKNGSKNKIKKHPKESESSLFIFSSKLLKPSRNNTLKVAKDTNVLYNQIKFIKF